MTHPPKKAYKCGRKRLGKGRRRHKAIREEEDNIRRDEERAREHWNQWLRPSKRKTESRGQNIDKALAGWRTVE